MRLAYLATVGIAASIGALAAEDGLAPARALLQSGRAPVRIVCFGDSITGVYYHTGGKRAWCDMLRIGLGRIYPKAKIEMINAGVSGNTSAMGLERMERDVLSRRPNLVVVMFGMNDAVGTPREEYESNLRTIVRRARGIGAEVVLCTPNSVYPNPKRPLERLAAFSQTVRDVASKRSVAFADCFQAYEELRERDPLGWKLLMSETIHPSMNGHKLFAEVLTKIISGREVSLADVPPPDNALAFTLQRVRAGQPVRIVAMPPYDKIVPEVLHRVFPKAEVEVALWPVEGRTLADLEEWSKSIRSRNPPPDLVVVAVPATATAEDQDAFLTSYSWVMSYSVPFGQRTWDRVTLLPAVTAPVPLGQEQREALTRRIVQGADTAYVERREDDGRPAAELVEDFIRSAAASIALRGWSASQRSTLLTADRALLGKELPDIGGQFRGDIMNDAALIDKVVAGRLRVAKEPVKERR